MSDTQPDPLPWNSVAELIEQLGNPAPIATGLGLPYTTVKSWADRGRIDPVYWSRLIMLAEARGIGLTEKQLTRLHTPAGAEALVRLPELQGASAR